MNIRVVCDLDECARLWQLVGAGALFQLWEVRLCFHEEFGHRPHFVVAEEADRIVGLLPLSWVEELNRYAFFPGEIWHNKTWLERNRIWAVDPATLGQMFNALDAPAAPRYLEANSIPAGFGTEEEDEIGYLFHPPQHQYDFAAYQSLFPGKTLRKFQKEIAGLEEAGVTYRYNELDDIPRMFQMNIDAFGDYSYFRDPRFLRSFERLVGFLHDHQALLTTTVLIGGRIAAIDLGGVWNNAYSVLAGGVDRQFAGVAKLINFHHLERACALHFDEVDFLCGDFGWKERFRLTPRPLMKISSPSVAGTLALTGETRLVEYP